ncbi:MAG: Mur ligase domain-containing protein, partial [Nitrospinota bacterium]|nr:Mur ligase domain-containing protein [Nitrospinota bacterium]
MDSDLETLVNAMQGECLMGEPSQKFRGVSINSRTLKSGELFFCIRGDRFDGHEFLDDAIEKKAAGVVVSDRAKLDASLAQQAGIFAV